MMNTGVSLQSLLRLLPKGKALTRLLAIGAVLLVGTGCLMFVTLVVMPKVKAMDEKVAALTAAKRDLVDAEEKREQELEQLQVNRVKVEDALEEKLGIFMSKAQAATAVDRLYLYASKVGVEISDLQSIPGPKPGKGLDFEAEAFRVIARGSLPGLMDFIEQIQETQVYKAFLLTNVQVAEAGGAGGHVLTMDVTLYMHASATGEPLIGLPSAGLVTPPAEAAMLEPQEAAPADPQAAPTPHPYLVKPADWPDEWPWPPEAQNTDKVLYTVVEGDTLAAIAERFGTTIGTLMDMNQLTDTHIEAGQQLRVP
jgi:hypothetical protein